MKDTVPPGRLDYETVFHASSSPYLIMTADFTIVTVNRAYADATLIDPEAVVGRPVFEVFPDNPATPEAHSVANLRRSLEFVVRTGASSSMARQRYDVRAPDGTFVERYWSPVNTPILDHEGRVAYIIHRVQDVTELVRMSEQVQARERGEEALQTRLEQMEADLFNRALEIQDANRSLQGAIARLEATAAELQEQHEAKDRFIATLSHELRNPLAAVRAALDVLALDIAGHPVLEVLDRQTAALTRMTDDLLDAARGMTGRLTVQRRPLDLRALVEQVVADAESAHAGTARTVDLVLPDTAVPVDGDAVRLGQAVGNLVDNAFKHTPAEAAVSVRLSVEDGLAEIRVQDTGPGFDAAAAERLFDPFHRESGPRRRAPSGLGLGLAVVRGIIGLHDGTVTAHSDGPGTGATFTVRLPLTRTVLPGASPAAEPAATGGHRASTASGRRTRPGPLRILIIDDNEDLARAYRSVLTDRGHHVTVAFTAGDGLAQARNTFDVILCDIVLGEDIDGYEIARRLRAAPQHRRTRFVAISGFGRDTDKIRALEAGFDAHLTKPLDTDGLERLLRWWSEEDVAGP